MGMVCYLRQISRNQSDEIDANPDKAYELILGQKIEPDTHDRLLRRADEAIKKVEALHEKHASTLQRVRQANANREPISVELRKEYELWLTEYTNLTAPWSTRRAKELGSERKGVDDGSAVLSVDKSWHGLHFLLTGRLEGGEPPLSLALIGGRAVPDRYGLLGFGPALKLTPAEVASVSQALQQLSSQDLLERYNPEEMQRQGVYAIGEHPAEDREYLEGYYEKLAFFYPQARAAQNGMLIYLR